jgi:hypothetical protein
MTRRDLGNAPTSPTHLIRDLDCLSQIRRDLDRTGCGPDPVSASTGCGTGSGAYDDVVIDMLELQDLMGEGRRL